MATPANASKVDDRTDQTAAAPILRIVAPLPESEWTKERIDSILFPVQSDGTRLCYGMNAHGRWAMFTERWGAYFEQHECSEEEFAELDQLDGIVITFSRMFV